MLNFLSNSRDTRNLLLRMLSVLSRFGFGPKRFESSLRKYAAVARTSGYVPTFAITAVTLERHPEYIRELSKNGVEFALHGYIHTDYAVLPMEEQVAHLQKAVDIFHACNVPFTGFRAPFLRTNSMTPSALGQLKLLYDSSHIITWDVLDKNRYSQPSQQAYQRLLNFYKPHRADEYIVLPRFINDIVEIPVSIPDDEAMIDRLFIKDPAEITRVWQAILDMTHLRGELFTIQLHPERVPQCAESLASVVQQAKQLSPQVWMATLGEIAGWWQQKARFTLKVIPQQDGKFRVLAECPAEATLLVKQCKLNVPTAEWSHGYQTVSARDFSLESRTRPAIGVAPDSSSAAVSFLQGEGYVVERNAQPSDYAFYLDSLARFAEADERPLAEKIEKADVPLVRLWRWPNNARSALAVTGDIDAMTLSDFALRIWENWRQGRKLLSLNAR